MNAKSALKAKLSQIEARLQALVEGGTARLFPGSQAAPDLSEQLVEAMRAGIRIGPEGETLAPNLFTLLVHPSRAEALEADQALIFGLTRALQKAGQEAGLSFTSPPVLRFDGDPQLSLGEMQVLARNSLEALSETTDVPVELAEDDQGKPSNAFLIVDGTQIFQLEGGVVNIGRHEDNQLVIDEARVSRLHAQLRPVKGRYVIFDLNSKGGTWVNGQRIRQQALYPGDVISLSGVPLVFGQEALDPGETQEYVPGP